MTATAELLVVLAATVPMLQAAAAVWIVRRDRTLADLREEREILWAFIDGEKSETAGPPVARNVTTGATVHYISSPFWSSYSVASNDTGPWVYRITPGGDPE